MKHRSSLFAVCCLLFCALGARAQLGTIWTYANVGACNIAVDPSGHLYTANAGHIYRIDSGGTQTSVVGGGSTYGDGGPATSAQLTNALNVAFDNAGNMLIADMGAGVIRKVDLGNIISTVAGNHTLGVGYTGDGGPATAATINASHVCADQAGNIFIADKPNNVVRKVNAAGIITTVAGNGTAGHSGDGGPATAAALEFYSQQTYWG